MLRNEKYYREEDLSGVMAASEISGDEMQGDYFAIGDDGKAYGATFVNKDLPGGVFYSVIPSGVKVLGYVPANQKSEGTVPKKQNQAVKRRMNHKRVR